jgi:hypothetical protein
MDSSRFRRIQRPSQVERLLEAFTERGKILPEDSHRVRDPSALPLPLRGIAVQAVREGRVWACWISGGHQWLFTAELSLPLSRGRGIAVLHVNRYCGAGELTEAGFWTTDPDGQWCRFVA